MAPREAPYGLGSWEFPVTRRRGASGLSHRGLVLKFGDWNVGTWALSQKLLPWLSGSDTPA